MSVSTIRNNTNLKNLKKNVMKETNFLNLSCRHCRHYQPEGRRGGSCEILGVSVDSSWKACTLASSPFEKAFTDLNPNLTNLNTALTTLEEIVHLETALSLPYKLYKNNRSQVRKFRKNQSLIAKKTFIT